MIDLTEMNIMFTLNGEMLISDSGSEMAFKDIEIGEGRTSIDILLYSFFETLERGMKRLVLLRDVFLVLIFCVLAVQVLFQCVLWACHRLEGLIWVRMSAACATLPSVACRKGLNLLVSI